MKVIDLLNKIANNEEVPKKIKYSGKEYAYDIEHNDYVTTKRPHDVISLSLTWSYQYSDEIEIIEEKPKKIEELDIDKMLQTKKWKRDKNAWKKINELIKAVNYLLEKESDK